MEKIFTKQEIKSAIGSSRGHGGGSGNSMGHGGNSGDGRANFGHGRNLGGRGSNCGGSDDSRGYYRKGYGGYNGLGDDVGGPGCSSRGDYDGQDMEIKGVKLIEENMMVTMKEEYFGGYYHGSGNYIGFGSLVDGSNKL